MVPLALSFVGGRKTTCMVITHPGISPKITLESASVLLFSKILPAFINLRSLIVFGPFCFSAQTHNSTNQIPSLRKRPASRALEGKHQNSRLHTFWPVVENTLFDVGHCSCWRILVGTYVSSIIQTELELHRLLQRHHRHTSTPPTLILTIAKSLRMTPNTAVYLQTIRRYLLLLRKNRPETNTRTKELSDSSHIKR
jgi:hypothetical protein